MAFEFDPSDSHQRSLIKTLVKLASVREARTKEALSGIQKMEQRELLRLATEAETVLETFLALGPDDELEFLWTLYASGGGPASKPSEPASIGPVVSCQWRKEVCSRIGRDEHLAERITSGAIRYGYLQEGA